VEFITQALQLRHGARHPEIRRANTLRALSAIGEAGLLPAGEVETVSGHYRFLQRLSSSLRLFGVRPTDVLQTVGFIPDRVARDLGAPGRQEFLDDYARRTGEVRSIYQRVFPEAPGSATPIPTSPAPPR